MADYGLAPSIGIAEVAALAGVSAATVSRALRGIPGVAAATKANVEQAAAALGYVASPTAAALTTGRTGAIGIIAPPISKWFFGAAIEGAHEAVAKQGYVTMLYPLGAGGGAATCAVAGRALHKRVDGILGLNVRVGADPPTLRVPMVTVGTTIPGVSGVLIDDVEVGYAATVHLLEMGHRRIAFLGGDPHDAFGLAAAANRGRGYEKALREHHIEVDPDWIGAPGFTIDGGGKAFDKLWCAAGRQISAMPTAVFAVSDEVAMGVASAARRLGIRIPEDVSLIGVDNHDMAYLFELTTISQRVREQGRIAAMMLLDQVRTGEPPALRMVRLKPRLIIRRTVAPPRRP